MALTEREAFRFGFLLRCAQEGLSEDQVRDRVKQAGAAGGIGTAVGGGLSGLGTLLSGAARAGGEVGNQLIRFPIHASLLGLGTAAMGGAGAGYGLAKMQEDKIDPDEAKRQELLAAYQMQIDRALRKAKQQRHRVAAPTAPSLTQI